MSLEGPTPPASAPNDAKGKRSQRRPLFLFAPLLVGLLVLAGWLIWRDAPATVPQSPVMATAGPPTVGVTAPASAPATDVPGDGFGIVPGLATPWAVAGGPGAATAEAATATAAPAPTLAPIVVFGPPAGATFQPADVVTFYWTAPAARVGQRFAVYIVAGDEMVELGAVGAANMGQAYQLQATPGEAVDEPGAYSWLVVWANEADGVMIGQSENRPITILAAN